MEQEYDDFEPITDATVLVLGDWVSEIRDGTAKTAKMYRLGIWIGDMEAFGLFEDGVDPTLRGKVIVTKRQEQLVRDGYQKAKDRTKFRFAEAVVHFQPKGQKTSIRVQPGLDPLKGQ